MSHEAPERHALEPGAAHPVAHRARVGPGRDPPATPRPASDAPPPTVRSLELAPNDPLLAYFHGVAEAVDLDKITLHGPALQTVQTAGIQLVVPLVSQGELIGLLGLGPRRSEQDYSADDRALLSALATTQATAAGARHYPEHERDGVHE